MDFIGLYLITHVVRPCNRQDLKCVKIQIPIYSMANKEKNSICAATILNYAIVCSVCQYVIAQNSVTLPECICKTACKSEEFQSEKFHT